MKKVIKKISRLKIAVLPIILGIILIASIIATIEILFEDRFFPGTFLGDTSLTYLTRKEAINTLNSKFEKRKTANLHFEYAESTFSIDLATASAKISFDNALDQAFKIGHSGNFLERANDQVKLLFQKQTFSGETVFFIDSQIEKIDQQTYLGPIDGNLIVDENQILINPGKSGLKLDEDALKKAVTYYLNFGFTQKSLPIKALEPKVTNSNLQKAKYYLDSVKKTPLKLTFEDKTFEIDYKTLITLIDLEAKDKLIISPSKLDQYLTSVATKINQPVEEGQFEFNQNTKRVTTFSASQEGRQLDSVKTALLIKTALESGNTSPIELPVAVISPKIKTEEVNNLGVKELLGEGVSNFAGSIENRIFNLSLAASRINGVLIAPGEKFSFNSQVGDISGSSGYKPAYVIKEGRTVLDDGGGVCQVSTTIFRAVLNAGLPIVARTAHAYRVGYYEQGFPPGLDATVFSPSVDFIFKNDTQNYILIQATRVGTTLTVDLYGTSDGRVSTLTKPVVTNFTPAPPEIRQDDPTLPRGVVKQVDFAASGATVSFSRLVTKNGQTLISETFRSAYKPWQAIFLVGTQ